MGGCRQNKSEMLPARHQVQSLSDSTRSSRDGNPTHCGFWFVFFQSSVRLDGGESAPQLFPARTQPSWGTEQSRSSGCGTKTHGEGIKGAVNTQWPGGRTVSDAACASLLSKSELAHTMVVGAAFEALRATLDLLSQTKNGGSLDLLIRCQVL